MKKLFLISGVSGVGKSSLIKELLALDDQFVYIVPFTTRPSRGSHDTKISISDEAMDDLWSRGELLSVNEIYGIRCGTPRTFIKRVLDQDQTPLLDWPVSCLEVMRSAFPNQLYVVYVLPPSIHILQQRLMKDERPVNPQRWQNTVAELEAYKARVYAGVCDLEIVSEEDQIFETAQIIYTSYVSSSLKK